MYEVFVDGRILDFPGDTENFIVDPELDLALKVGCKTMNGLGMMLYQGAAAFEL